MGRKQSRKLSAARECDDLAEICLEIYSNTGWAQDLEIPLEQPRGYHDTLERIIFLFKVYLKFTLEFIGLSPNVVKNFPKQRSISKPLDLGVSALSYTVWTRVKFLVADSLKKEAKLAEEESKSEITHQETQTELLTLVDCENCEISKDIIRQLINKVDILCSKYNINSFVGIIRQQLRPRIHEITAWAAMTFWYEAIMFDIETLSKLEKKENNDKPKVKLNQLKDTINKLETKLGYGHFTVQGEEIRKLKKKALKLTIKLVKKSEESKDITEKLKGSENNCKKLQNEIHELKNKSDIEQKCILELNKNIADKMEEINYIMAKYEKEIECYNRKIQLLELDVDSKQLLINEQFTSISLLERKLQESVDNEIKLKEKLVSLQHDLDSLNDIKIEFSKLEIKYNEKCKQERKLGKKLKRIETDLILAEESELMLTTTEISPSFPVQLTGDVQIDTAMQKVTNEQRIKLLQSKNKKLQSTLDKIFIERNKTGNNNFLEGQTTNEIKEYNDYISYIFLCSVVIYNL